MVVTVPESLNSIYSNVRLNLKQASTRIFYLDFIPCSDCFSCSFSSYKYLNVSIEKKSSKRMQHVPFLLHIFVYIHLSLLLHRQSTCKSNPNLWQWLITSCISLVSLVFLLDIPSFCPNSARAEHFSRSNSSLSISKTKLSPPVLAVV